MADKELQGLWHNQKYSNSGQNVVVKVCQGSQRFWLCS